MTIKLILKERYSTDILDTKTYTRVEKIEFSRAEYKLFQHEMLENRIKRDEQCIFIYPKTNKRTCSPMAFYSMKNVLRFTIEDN